MAGLSAPLLLLATQNTKKRKELEELARGRFAVCSLADVGLHALDVAEDGDTFAANAEKKARGALAALHAAHHTDVFAVLADDSGLEVDALDGKPGVRSARFAADHGCSFLGDSADQANNALLLTLLSPVPAERRGARFVAHVCAVVVDTGAVERAEGRVEGAIARDLQGAGGFGYDPLFLPAAIPGKRLAEVSSADKHSISHRGQATRAVLAALARRAVFRRARTAPLPRGA
jgi:XTP/dITP diphosphohydrolase